MWTPEIIRARFVEAAHTERHLASPFRPDARGFWPKIFHDKEDRDGWDDQAKQEDMEAWQGRGSAKADALSRHQECLDWTVSLIDDAKPLTAYRVRVLWTWARCRNGGLDFGARCHRMGISRPTGYRRLTDITEQLSQQHNMIGLLLRLPDEEFLRQEEAPVVSSMRGVGNPIRINLSTSGIPFSPSFRTDVSCDLLKSERDVTDFQSHLDAVNAERRKLLERKRRAKIGVMAS
jgi:hypothetical protein